MGARCSKLSVCWWPPHFKSPMLGTPPTAHCHHRCLPLGFSVFFVFSLSSSHSRRAWFFCCWGRRRRPGIWGVFFFCCGFSGVSAVRFRVRVISCFRLVGCGPVDLAGTVAPIPSVRFVRTRKSDPNRGSPWPAAATCCADSSRFSSARFGEFACSREVSRLNRVWFSAFLRALSWRRAM